MTKCNEVWIYFIQPHKQGIRLSYSEETAAHYLRVSQDKEKLTVEYKDLKGRLVKSVNFNYQHILEWDCKEIFTDPVSKVRETNGT